MQRPLTRVGLLTALCLVLATGAQAAPSDAHAAKANESIRKAIAFLRTTQAADGSWNAKPGPAVTGLVLAVLLDQPDIKKDDPAVTKAVAFILKHVQKDGGIYPVMNDVGMLENYNTSICVSALSRLGGDPKIAEVVKNAKKYLKDTQWTSGQPDPKGEKVGEDHPFYGGTGYGKHGRPDGSNLNVTLQAFIDTGSDCKDPEIVAAVQFFSRLQGSKANTKYGDKIQPDGGAVYATSVDKTKIGVPQSQAGEIEINGASKLRTYGSMTYAMFRSYVYAQLDKNDPRVIDALKWVRHNYTLEVNPGMPAETKFAGYYYYLVTFSRALSAYGQAEIESADGKKHNWANDLIDKLASLQKPDGSWINEHDRWLEGDADIVTAYALTALQAARR